MKYFWWFLKALATIIYLAPIAVVIVAVTIMGINPGWLILYVPLVCLVLAIEFPLLLDLFE